MHQVLARKWRPHEFNAVIGQEHIVRALSNALAQQRLHHAYLFTGTRGVGKTTIARILAKCFNCQTGITDTPCGKCDTCLEVDNGSFIDLIEVDAASRTRVEDTRDLLDNVQYLPVSGRYKVYIIDEVHMLSGHSFNALLKTFEEPPEHVKFLLATTDPQKLPITILSRCLQFNLKKLSPNLIQQQLSKILLAENISYEDEALMGLAHAADGSVRDALSLLDQAIAYGAGSVKNSDVCDMLGAINRTYIFQLLESLATTNANAILNIVHELAIQAKDFNLVLDELLNCLHQVSIVQLLSFNESSATSASNTLIANHLQWMDDIARLQKLASTFTSEEIQLYYQIGLIGKRDLSLVPTMQSGFEMIMMRMLAFRPLSLAELVPAIDTDNTADASVSIAMPIIENKCVTTAPTTNTGANVNSICNIHDLISKLKVTGPTAALLQHCVLSHINEHEAVLILARNQAPLLNKNHEERLQKALSEFFGKIMRVVINLGDDGAATALTPAAQKEQRKLVALQTLKQNVKIESILNIFDATVVSESIAIEANS